MRYLPNLHLDLTGSELQALLTDIVLVVDQSVLGATCGSLMGMAVVGTFDVDSTWVLPKQCIGNFVGTSMALTRAVCRNFIVCHLWRTTWVLPRHSLSLMENYLGTAQVQFVTYGELLGYCLGIVCHLWGTTWVLPRHSLSLMGHYLGTTQAQFVTYGALPGYCLGIVCHLDTAQAMRRQLHKNVLCIAWVNA